MVQGWRTINVKEGLLEEVERTLLTKVMKEKGITNISQFVTTAIREKVEKVERKRFAHINTYEDHTKILDNNLEKYGRIVSVYFRGKRAWCDYCEEYVCVHIQHAWEIPDVKKILKAKNITSPDSQSL